jgi:tripartite-type tricarboxylate transporter receptor subunit TctC
MAFGTHAIERDDGNRDGSFHPEAVVVPAAPAWQLDASGAEMFAVTAARRSPALPDMPSLAEAGVPGCVSTSWFGLFAPAGTPEAIVQRMAREMAAFAHRPDIAQRVRALSTEPITNTPEDFAAMVRAEIAKWGGVVRASGARVD